MKYHILTLFPEMIEQGLHTSILGRAINNGYISLETTNIREFSANKFNRVDDYPYGGGAGMVMEAEPVFRAYQSVAEKIGKKPRTVESLRGSREPHAHDQSCDGSNAWCINFLVEKPEQTVYNRRMARHVQQRCGARLSQRCCWFM